MTRGLNICVYEDLIIAIVDNRICIEELFPFECGMDFDGLILNDSYKVDVIGKDVEGTL